MAWQRRQHRFGCDLNLKLQMEKQEDKIDLIVETFAVGRGVCCTGDAQIGRLYPSA